MSRRGSRRVPRRSLWRRSEWSAGPTRARFARTGHTSEPLLRTRPQRGGHVSVAGELEMYEPLGDWPRRLTGVVVLLCAAVVVLVRRRVETRDCVYVSLAGRHDGRALEFP